MGDVYLDSTSDKAYRDQWITRRKELTQVVVGQTEKVMSETEKLVAEYAAERTELLSDAELTAANTMAVATADGEAQR